MRKKNRILAGLLAAALLCGLLPTTALASGTLTIADETVTLPARGGATEGADGTWRLSRDGGRYTLTLQNAALTGPIATSLDNLTIEVPAGTVSTISTAGSCISSTGENLTLTGAGRLELTAADASEAVMLYSTGNIAVEELTLTMTGACAAGLSGKGTVTLQDTDVTVELDYAGTADCAGIYGGSGVAVDGGKLTIHAAGGGITRGIYCGKRLSLVGGTVDVRAQAGTGCIAIASQGGGFIGDGAVYAEANSAAGLATGIDSWSQNLNLVISGGSVTAKGSCAASDRSYSYGIRAHQLYLSGGAVSASGPDGGIVTGKAASDTITVAKAVTVQQGGSVQTVTQDGNSFQTFSDGAVTFRPSGWPTGGAAEVRLSGPSTEAAEPAAAEAPKAPDGPVVAYIPLDDRPVNTDRVIYEARAAGFTILMPEAELYATALDGQPRGADNCEHGDTEALLDWMMSVDAQTDCYVISLDQILSGGLVNSRVMTDKDLTEAYAALDLVAQLAETNRVYVVDTVLRLACCTVGYHGATNETYQALREYGLAERAVLDDSELNLGAVTASYTTGAYGRRIAVSASNRQAVDDELAARTRKMNLLNYLLQHDGGKVTYFIGVDDSASGATIQTNEVNWIRSALDGRGTIYSGTDELGMMAVARMAADYYGANLTATVTYFGDTQHSDTGSVYDMDTAEANVRQHLASLGVQEVSSGGDLAVLVLTAPEEKTLDVKYINRMIDTINSNIAAGIPTVVINPVPGIYSGNLEYRMTRECELGMLLAYSSWNTAGNAIGIALANGVSRMLYLGYCKESSAAADEAFLQGLTFSYVKDICYLRAGGKTLFNDYLTKNGLSTSNFYRGEAQAASVQQALEDIMTGEAYNVTVQDVAANLEGSRYLKSGGGEYGMIGRVLLSDFCAPWYRSFEIRFRIRAIPSAMTAGGYTGAMTVSVPVTPEQGAATRCIYVLDSDGKFREIPCKYNAATGCLVFQTKDLTGIYLPTLMTGMASVSAKFTDVNLNSWYLEDVFYADEKGYLTGMGDSLFRPDQPMTRAQLAAALYKMSGAGGANFTSPFRDVSDAAWYRDAVLWAYSEGILAGYADGSFGASANVTRQELAVTLFRFADYLGIQPTAAAEALEAYKDGQQAKPYAAGAMGWTVQSGILTGDDQGRLLPGKTATRAQTASVLHRLCDLSDI